LPVIHKETSGARGLKANEKGWAKESEREREQPLNAKAGTAAPRAFVSKKRGRNLSVAQKEENKRAEVRKDKKEKRG